MKYKFKINQQIDGGTLNELSSYIDLTYKELGVDIHVGEEFFEDIDGETEICNCAKNALNFLMNEKILFEFKNE